MNSLNELGVEKLKNSLGKQKRFNFAMNLNTSIYSDG